MQGRRKFCRGAGVEKILVSTAVDRRSGLGGRVISTGVLLWVHEIFVCSLSIFNSDILTFAKSHLFLCLITTRLEVLHGRSHPC